MATARFALSKLSGLSFWKLCGSGTGEGFTPKPNWGVWAILSVWDNDDDQRAGLQSAVFKKWRSKSDENWTVTLRANQARGTWSDQHPFAVDAPIGPGPIVALTRATIRPRILAKFWQRVPNISAVIGADPNVIFKIGIGEVPWLHQVTFSIWPDAKSMANFARRDGPHAKAIQAVRDGNWFKEELYARFHLLDDQGTWNGVRPLSDMKGTPP